MKFIAVPNTNGRTRTIEILEYEFQGLLRALRRDMHAQALHRDREHGLNARLDLRLLELLQPKRNVDPAMLASLTAAAAMEQGINASVDAV